MDSRQPLLRSVRQGNLFSLRGVEMVLHRVLQQGIDIRRFPREVETAGFELGEVEKIVDQLDETGGGVFFFFRPPFFLLSPRAPRFRRPSLPALRPGFATRARSPR